MSDSIHVLYPFCCKISGHYARVQAALLDEQSTFSTIDATFLQQFAVIIEPQWKYFAPYITPSSPPPGIGSDVPIFDQLKQWKERMQPTFGDLDEILSRLYIQSPSHLLVVVPHPRIPTPGRDHDGTYIHMYNQCVDCIEACIYQLAAAWMSKKNFFIDSPPCHHACPDSLSDMCSTPVHSEIVDNMGKTVVCKELGFSIVFPPEAIGSTPVTVSVCCSFKTEFSAPTDYEFVSPAYILHVHPVTQFLKKVTLSLQHWAKSDGSDLCFGFCPFPNISSSYSLQVKDGGDFVSHEQCGRIEVDHFSVGSLLRKLKSKLLRRSRNHYYSIIIM